MFLTSRSDLGHLYGILKNQLNTVFKEHTMTCQFKSFLKAKIIIVPINSALLKSKNLS